VLLASWLLATARHLDRGAAPQAAPPAAAAANERLASLGSRALEDQVRLVIRSFDETGRPPDGVAQGGRRGGPRGVFDNAQGRLPRKPPRYYAESDVWPRGSGGRGAERLIFGKEGEVYYTPDHYESFVRVR
jgi:guanyl-specific ribonuclease Sa